MTLSFTTPRRFNPAHKEIPMIGALHRNKSLLLSLATLTLVWSIPSVASPQNLSSAAIEGTVTDQSGRILPGVTVTASSPALQVGQVTTVADGEGAVSLRRPGTRHLPGAVRAVRFQAGLTPRVLADALE
jgi:hypothetical protein